MNHLNYQKKIASIASVASAASILAILAIVAVFGFEASPRIAEASPRTQATSTEASPMYAATVSLEALPDKVSYNDFVVGPGKVEVELAPAGESKTFELSRLEPPRYRQDFHLAEEDFKGSDDSTQTVVLLGDDRGPYSLKDYVHIATSSIVIAHGSRARIPVTIAVPANAQPGGLYGSVVIGTATAGQKIDSGNGSSVGTSPVITRIGTLFFVRVKGAMIEKGSMTAFSLAGNKSILWNENADISFNIQYKNEGNVHVNPSAEIVVKNMLGSQVGAITVEPWFAMPNSLRFREIAWAHPFMFGRYTAEITLNRGYDFPTKDTATVSFWVIPWVWILVVIAVLTIIIAFIKMVLSKFKISRK